MDWQQIAALGVVAATAAIFLRAKLRPRKFSFQRQTHCGCGSASQSAPNTSIVFHARKGERSRVEFKIK